jgi:hypothetical protein
MKKILSVSLGSCRRDHVTECEFLGQACQLSRRGTDGDFDKAIELYREYDGKVDAFGVGGTFFYVHVGDRRYYWREMSRIREAVKISKIGDGNGVKGLLAGRAFAALEQHLQKEGRTLRGMRGLMTCAVDRYGMAEAMVDSGVNTVIGDFMFTMGLNLPMRRLSTVRAVAGVLLPVITRLPFRWFYPLGEEQDREPNLRWRRYYEEAELIAGDFLQIRDYMPPDMSGKIILTNTTTAADREELQKRGARILVTTTPRLAGRSFGTNVIEATLLALSDKPQEQIGEAEFLELIGRIPILPTIEVLN